MKARRHTKKIYGNSILVKIRVVSESGFEVQPPKAQFIKGLKLS